jgi:hypothetical protein
MRDGPMACTRVVRCAFSYQEFECSVDRGHCATTAAEIQGCFDKDAMRLNFQKKRPLVRDTRDLYFVLDLALCFIYNGFRIENGIQTTGDVRIDAS